MSQKPRYQLTESFYDNLVLWEKDETVEWEGIPAPSMIPLNKAAEEKMKELRKAMAKPYTPPLSELADTMDGRVTTSDFSAGDRKNRPAKGKTPPFPKRPGSAENRPQYAAKRIVENSNGDDEVDEDTFVGGSVGDPHAALPDVPQKAAKNFDRVAK